MGKYKDEHGTTRVGDFIRKNAPHLVEMVGDVLPDKGALGIVKNIISKDEKLSGELKAEAMRLIELDYADVQDARKMQMAALAQDDVFAKRFVYYLAAFIVAGAFIFGLLLFFVDFPKENKRLIEMFCDIFLFGGALMVLNFFFGSSAGSKEKLTEIFRRSK